MLSLAGEGEPDSCPSPLSARVPSGQGAGGEVTPLLRLLLRQPIGGFLLGLL
jgi:hypothetical protein